MRYLSKPQVLTQLSSPFPIFNSLAFTIGWILGWQLGWDLWDTTCTIVFPLSHLKKVHVLNTWYYYKRCALTYSTHEKDSKQHKLCKGYILSFNWSGAKYIFIYISFFSSDVTKECLKQSQFFLDAIGRKNSHAICSYS